MAKMDVVVVRRGAGEGERDEGQLQTFATIAKQIEAKCHTVCAQSTSTTMPEFAESPFD